MKSLIDRLRDRCTVDEVDGCWLWRQSVSEDGYPQIQITELFGRRSFYVRRLMYTIACGPLTSRQVVTSTCKNPLCCAPLHLRAMSPAQAAGTNLHRQRQSRGKTHGLAVRRGRTRAYKLDGKVAEIRARLAAGESQKALAVEYGVHKTTISHLWRGCTWAEATPFSGLKR